MMKFMKRLAFIFLIVAYFIFSFSSVWAANITLSASEDARTNGKIIKKVYPGDEFYIAFKIEGENSKDVKAIYGNLDYDKNIFELSEEDNPIVEDGWKATNIKENDNKFFFHTQSKEASETIGYVKMKVKSNVDKSGKCTISIKDVNLYKESGINSFGELTHEKYNADITLKIGNKKENLRNIIVLVASIIVFIIILIAIGKGNKKRIDGNDINKDEIVLDDDDIINSDDSLVMDSKDNRSEIQAKMRAVLDEVKRKRVEKENKENSKAKNEEVIEDKNEKAEEVTEEENSEINDQEKEENKEVPEQSSEVSETSNTDEID